MLKGDGVFRDGRQRRVYSRFFILMLYLFVSPCMGISQISMGGSPLKSALPLNEVEWIDLGELKADELLLEDQWLALTGRKNQRFASEIEVSLSPEQAGNWEELADGTIVWRLGIRGRGAKALGIEFSRYELYPGIRIFIHDPSGENVLGAYTSRNNKTSGTLPVSFLPGDELVIQMEVPPECGAYGNLEIGFARWAYLPVFSDMAGSDEYFGKSGSCNVDINCNLGDNWQIHKNSVVRMITAREKCTGVLVNNTRQDQKAYVYTAAHCVFQDNKYQNPIFYFRYESPNCDGPDGSTSFSISGATLIATGDTLENDRDADSLDFALLELSVAPPDYYQPYYAGWNRSTTPAQNATAIHHPSGDVKKISVSNNQPEISYHQIDYFPDLVRYSHWRILQWDWATTEGGSSGCPVFDHNQLLIGTLTGGQASCSSSINDYFTRFDYAWDYYPEPARQIKHWLDPDHTGVMNLGGLPGWNVGVSRMQKQEELNLYPNPADDRINVGGGLAMGTGAEIRIYDVTGKLIMQKTLVWDGEARLDVGGLTSGIYVLRLMQEDRTASRRFMISR